MTGSAIQSTLERPQGASHIVGMRLAVFGLWLGLVYGLIEALEAMLWTLIPGGLSWLNGTAPPILWVAPLVYGVLFGILGLIAAGLARLFPKVAWDFGLVFFLVGTGAYLAASLQRLILDERASVLLGLGFAVTLSRTFRARRDWWAATALSSLPWLVGGVALLAIGTTAIPPVLEARRLAALPAPAAGRPNILLLVIDTQRADHLSAYGYQRPTSPELDKLAARGWLFENATSSSSWTLPSHATIMTGREQLEHRAGVLRRPYLDRRFTTVAEALRDAGYATAGFVANIYWCGRETGLGRGFIHYEDYFRTFGDALARTVIGRRFTYDIWPRLGPRNIPGRKSAADVNASLLHWIDGNRGHPFFVFANYMDVHGPLFPPAPFRGRFSDPALRPTGEPGVQLGAIAGEFKRLSPEEIQADIDAYDESILYLDSQIGALLQQLDQRKILDSTLVIVTSDHGESFGEHGFYFHGHSLYRDQISIPLLLQWPSHLQAGIRRSDPVSLDRIAATIAGAAGVADQVPGRSLLDPPVADGVSVSELAQRSTVPASWPASRGWVAALVSDRWHLIVEQSGKTELYDFRNDPGELTDLASDSTAVVANLRERFAGLVPGPIR